MPAHLKQTPTQAPTPRPLTPPKHPYILHATGAAEQLADTLTQTFTMAESSNKTLGVAVGIADAVGKMSGSQLSDTLFKVSMASVCVLGAETTECIRALTATSAFRGTHSAAELFRVAVIAP